MARTPAQDAPIRDLIRRNVGNQLRARGLHSPGAVAEPLLLEFGRGAAPTFPDIGGAALAIRGRSFHIFISVTGVNRRVLVTPNIGFRYQIRRVTFTGDWAATEQLTARLLVSTDADITAVAEPTGDDVIDFTGDLIGTEDPGLHLNTGVGPVSIEPWQYVFERNTRLKLKFHNNEIATTRRIGCTIDLDEVEG